MRGIAILAGLLHILLLLISLDGSAASPAAGETRPSDTAIVGKENDGFRQEFIKMSEEELCELRRRAARDPQRPKFHYAPPVFWINDPNGLIQFNGTYHIFFQYDLGIEQPYGGRKHWGHASSDDLIHWEHLPVAISPGKDYFHIASGSMVNNNGVPTAIYTGAEPQQQCIATSGPDLLVWEKHAGNPVISGPPQGLKVTGFRDPAVWKEEGDWIMGVGSGIKDQGGTVLLYRSPDLIHWEYLHPLFVGDKRKNGTMWECPNFFPLGGKYVLIVSAWTPPWYTKENHPDPPAALYPPIYKALYFVGTYKNFRFTPETQGELDLWGVLKGPGGDFYAPQAFADDQQRRILIGWALSGRDAQALKEAGWEGVMTFPRVLTLGAESRLHMNPVEELRSLRRRHHRFGPLEVSPDSVNLLGGLKGDPIELEAIIEPGRATQVGLLLRRSPDGKEQTRVFYDAGRRELVFDRERSSLSSHVVHGGRAGAFSLAPGEPLRLRLFTDRSIVEVYANERAAGTFRIYPSRRDSLGIDLFSVGGTATFRSVNAWELE